MTARPSLPSPAELTLLTDEESAARWRVLVGGLPAIKLSDRAEMIRLLIESMAPADTAPDGDASIDGRANRPPWRRQSPC